MTLKEYLKKVCDLEQAVYVKRAIIKKSEDELERVKNDGKNSKIKLEAELKEAQENYSRTQKRIEAYKNHSKNGWINCLTIAFICMLCIFINYFLLNQCVLSITSNVGLFLVLLITTIPLVFVLCLAHALLLVMLNYLEEAWWTILLFYLGITYIEYRYLVPNLGNVELFKHAISQQMKFLIMVVMIIGLVSAAITWIVQTINHSLSCNKADDLKPLLAKQKKHVQQLKSNITAHDNETVKVIFLMQQDISFLQQELKNINNQLQTVYDMDVIHHKYRYWVAVATIYEYIDTGICNALVGEHGAYKFYEEQLMSKRIVNTLDDIEKDIVKYGEGVADTQRFIRSSFAAVISRLYGHKVRTYGR